MDIVNRHRLDLIALDLLFESSYVKSLERLQLSADDRMYVDATARQITETCHDLASATGVSQWEALSRVSDIVNGGQRLADLRRSAEAFLARRHGAMLASFPQPVGPQWSCYRCGKNHGTRPCREQVRGGWRGPGRRPK